MHDFKIENETKADFTKGDTALHGDVIIQKHQLPGDFKDLKEVKDQTLAYGEFTGHSHKLFDGDFQLRQTSDGVKFLKVVEPCTLRHQEHNPIVLPPGEYKIGIQREYDPFSKLIRSVRD